MQRIMGTLGILMSLTLGAIILGVIPGINDSAHASRPNKGKTQISQFAVNNSKPAVGTKIVFRGKLRSTKKQTLTLQRRSGSNWKNITSKSFTAPKFSISHRIKFTGMRAYRVRVNKAGSRHYGYSSRIRITGQANQAASVNRVVVTDASTALVESLLLVYINNYRKAEGLSTIQWNRRFYRDDCLDDAARKFSTHMATAKLFAHSDDPSAWSANIIAQHNFREICATTIPTDVRLENIALGGGASPTAVAQWAFDAWRASPGHNSAMLLSWGTEFKAGLGVARDTDDNWWITFNGASRFCSPAEEPTGKCLPVS